MMTTLTTARRPRRPADPTPNQALARHRAVMAVILGAPPALVAADTGCDVSTLMRWVKAQRQEFRRANRPAAAPVDTAPADPADDHPDVSDDADIDDDGDDDPAPALRALRSGRGRRTLPIDRPVAPENSEVVEAAYRRVAFDYSGRRIPH